TMAFFCWCGGSERAASAITTALSPDSSMFTQIIWSKAIQNAAELSSIPLFPSDDPLGLNKHGTRVAAFDQASPGGILGAWMDRQIEKPLALDYRFAWIPLFSIHFQYSFISLSIYRGMQKRPPRCARCAGLLPPEGAFCLGAARRQKKAP